MLLSDIFLSERSRGAQSLPDLWMDGEGQFLYAAYPPTASTNFERRFYYKHAHVADEVLRQDIQDLKEKIMCSREYLFFSAVDSPYVN